MKIRLFRCLALSVLLVCGWRIQGQVVINEIMFHPPPAIPENPRQEWIELLNRGSSSVDLNGWRFNKGITYDLTNIVLQPQGYLVVAADVASFATNHPEVTNVVGGWSGRLANGGEKIELRNQLGEVVDAIDYAGDGDWGLVRVGEVYPGQPTWWQGWGWTNPADGAGVSMELANPALSNETGQNWQASRVAGGTPGRINSVATNDLAPLILDVQHVPAVPRSTNTVAVTARIIDDGPATVDVQLFSRVDGAAAFTAIPMLDDGTHGDGAAGDGDFGALLSPRPDQTVVEFYIQATDAAGHRRTWPPPTDDAGTQRANALYQVDDTVYAGNQPIYRFITLSNEWSLWLNLMDAVSNGRYSDAAMNATVVCADGRGVEVRYRALLRNRGAGTRAAHPHNFRVNLAGDRPLHGSTELAFNTRTVHSQVAGNAIFSMAGLPNGYGAPVQVRINGANLAHALPDGTTDSFQFGSYYCFEPYSSAWAEAHLPQDSQGNLYKGVWYQDNVQLTNGAVLDWRGASADNYRFAYGTSGPTSNCGSYSKQSNVAQDDWSDLTNLCYALNQAPEASYVSAISRWVNIDEWLGYFAANSLLINMETTLANGTGDDYSMFCGAQDPRFQLLNHDLDTVLGQGDATPSYTRSVFKAADIAALSRFLKHAEIAPRYFAMLKRMADTTFAPGQLGPLLDQVLGGWIPTAYIQSMKAAAEQRRTNVLAQIPQSLSVTSSLAFASGYPRTTVPAAALSGQADAIHTRVVLVNGVEAAYVPWQGSWTATNLVLFPGINRVLVQALGTNGIEFARTNIDLWFDDGSTLAVGGTILADTAWEAARGPYLVSSNLTIAGGATLAIEAGTTVYLGSNVNFIVANGGRLLAEGASNAPIRFTVAPGSGVSWGNLTIHGAVGSPESRIAFAHFEGNGASPCIEVAAGTVTLDSLSFGNRGRQYLALDGASFVVSRCTFPSGSAGFELVHGTGGIKAGGRGILRDCFFGTVTGYNDTIDFTGGNRDLGQPILQVYNNVFSGSGDDILDLDGTDAWIEGNLFLHVHKNGAPDSSSAVSGGNYDFGSGGGGVRTSEITLVRNLIFDCDHAVTAKEGNFYTLLNNTIARITTNGGLDGASAVINLRDITDSGSVTAFGAGCYLEGNLIVDAPFLVRNYDPAQSTVTFSNNLMPLAWTGPGGGNRTNSARIQYLPEPAEAQFSTWQAAQQMWDWLRVLPGSPATGAGPNGTDIGAGIPGGASISGAPEGVVAVRDALLTVGSLRSGNGIPAGGFPSGSGYTHYRARLDGGEWSAETPLATPIALDGLTNGPHRVEVVGKRDSGWFQDASELGTNAVVSTRTWTVDSGLAKVVINELMADNTRAWFVGEETSDAVELRNLGAQPVDLSGMGLTDDPRAPFKFTLPSGTVLGGSQYLVLAADSGTGAILHTGFKLDKDGGSLLLFAAASAGGALLDSITYGPQLTDYSIGRLPEGTWGLTQPTLGGANLAAPVGDRRFLRLNEWLAASLTRDDFVEIYNGDTLPVDLGGCFLSEVPDTWPARFAIAPLSFIPARGELVFIADSHPDSGARHLSFSLAEEWGALGLFAPDLTRLDAVVYGSQTSEVSMGRSPNGSGNLAFFSAPTPGAGNAGANGPCTVTNLTFTLMTYAQAWKYNQSNNLDGVAWYGANYDDSSWQGPGAGLLAFEDNSAITSLVHTVLLDPRKPPAGLGSGHAYYFRTALVVTNDLAGFTLNAKMRLDDCAVIYLNGTELSRPRLAAGVITNGTFGSGAIGSGTEATVEELFTIPVARFVRGTNVFAVEVHQVNSTSSDIVWGMALEATRSITNCAPPAVVLNEILASNSSWTNRDGTVTDWIEFYNPSPDPATLDGLSLTDDPASPRRWVFPSGSVLPGTNYLVVRCDGQTPATLVNGAEFNTGFGLRAGGGGVYLFDAGASLLEAMIYGPQAPDFSLARVPAGNGPWTLGLPTPNEANLAAATGDSSSIRINEWAASVSGGPDWFELYNPNPQPVAIGGFYLTDKLSNRTKHLIPPFSYLGVGNHGYAVFLADGNTTQGADHVNFSLDAGGEAIGLFGPDASAAIDSVVFGTQTAGVSEGRLPDGGVARAFYASPTPGEANWLPLTNAIVHEILSHTDPPLEDAIELFNPGTEAVDLSGWYLSDAKGDLRKYRIPDGTTLAPGRFVVFYEYQFNPQPPTRESFSLNSARGDEVWLTAAEPDGTLRGYRDRVAFGPQFNGVSFGRFQTSAGVDFTALSELTFGTTVTAQSPAGLLARFRSGAGGANAYPRVGPVVLSEILYQPPPIGTNDDTLGEFIELHNLTGEYVPLYDPLHATNGWRIRGGVHFDFSNQVLAPGEYLVLAGFDPATNGAALAAFRAKYGPGGRVVGAWSGKLANAGETVELLAPDQPETTGPDLGLVPYVSIDRVVYANGTPWPAGAGGTGLSLQRLNAAAYGNEPANWIAATPNPGGSGLADADGDAMPDAWERAHGLNPALNDSALDPDHDGFANLQEYFAGTDPQDAHSYLRLESVLAAPDGNRITFLASAGHNYSVLVSDGIGTGWRKLADVAAPLEARLVQITDPAGIQPGPRFYRLVTPALPAP